MHAKPPSNTFILQYTQPFREATAVRTIASFGSVEKIDPRAWTASAASEMVAALPASVSEQARKVWQDAGVKVVSVLRVGDVLSGAEAEGDPAALTAAGIVNFEFVAITDATLAARYVGGALASTEVTVPSSVAFGGANWAVTALVDEAFKGFNVTKVTLPASITNIGAAAFQNCSALTSVTAPAATTIGAYAFAGDEALAEIVLPTTQPLDIGEYAFANCTSFKSIGIPANSIIGANVFDGTTEMQIIVGASTAVDPSALGSASQATIIVSSADEAAMWDTGLPVAGNVVEIAEIQSPTAPIEIIAGQSAIILGNPGAGMPGTISAPEGASIVISYPASTITAKEEGEGAGRVVAITAYQTGISEVFVSIVSRNITLAQGSFTVISTKETIEKLPITEGMDGSAEKLPIESGVEGTTEGEEKLPIDVGQQSAEDEAASNAPESLPVEEGAAGVENEEKLPIEEGTANEEIAVMEEEQLIQSFTPQARSFMAVRSAAPAPKMTQSELTALIDSSTASLNIVATGVYGTRPNINGIKWTIFDNGLLEFESTGTQKTMEEWPAYAADNSALTYPANAAKLSCSWLNYKDYVLGVRVKSPNNYITFSMRSSIAGMFKDWTRLQIVNMSGFQTHQVSDMSELFKGCTSLQTVRFGNCGYAAGFPVDFDISNVTTMRGMFENCTNLGLIDWTGSFTRNEAAQDIDMSYMFNNCTLLRQVTFPGYTTRPFGDSVTTMAYMFSGCRSLTNFSFPIQFTGIKLQSTNSMFSGCESLERVTFPSDDVLDTAGLDVENQIEAGKGIKTMNSMFLNCHKLTSLDMTAWEVNQVTDLQSIFQNCYAITNINLSTWELNVNAAVTAGNMFNGDTSLVTITVGASWNRGNKLAGDALFTDCTSIQGASGQKYVAANTNYTFAKVGGNGYLSGKMLSKKPGSTVGGVYWELDSSGNLILTPEIGESGELASFTTDASGNAATQTTGVPPWYTCLGNIRSFKVANGKTITVESGGIYSNMFAGAPYLANVNFTGFNMSAGPISMYRMFYGCTALESVNILSFNTSNVRSMQSMFENCTALSTVDLTSFNVERVTDMSSMFKGCQSLVSVKFPFDDGTGNKTSKLPTTFNTVNVTTMNNMFLNCIKLKNIDLSNFKNPSPTNQSAENQASPIKFTAQGMFSNCKSLSGVNFYKTEVVQGATTDQNYTRMYGFDTTSCSDLSLMFNGCASIKTFDLSFMSAQACTTMASMFV